MAQQMPCSRAPAGQRATGVRAGRAVATKARSLSRSAVGPRACGGAANSDGTVNRAVPRPYRPSSGPPEREAGAQQRQVGSGPTGSAVGHRRGQRPNLERRRTAGVYVATVTGGDRNNRCPLTDPGRAAGQRGARPKAATPKAATPQAAPRSRVPAGLQTAAVRAGRRRRQRAAQLPTALTATRCAEGRSAATSRAVARPRRPYGGLIAVRTGGAAPGFAVFRIRGGRRARTTTPGRTVTWVNTPR